jgi:hypothetical protein
MLQRKSYIKPILIFAVIVLCLFFSGCEKTAKEDSGSGSNYSPPPPVYPEIPNRFFGYALRMVRNKEGTLWSDDENFILSFTRNNGEIEFYIHELGIKYFCAGENNSLINSETDTKDYEWSVFVFEDGDFVPSENGRILYLKAISYPGGLGGNFTGYLAADGFSYL